MPSCATFGIATPLNRAMLTLPRAISDASETISDPA
jgi:hypothetical protein